METLIIFVGLFFAVLGIGLGGFGGTFGLDWWLALPLGTLSFVLGVVLIVAGLGLVMIGERQVGVVVKKFSSRSLPAGRLVAINGEAGYQADTLAPGWHFGYWPWQFSVMKAPVIIIPQ